MAVGWEDRVLGKGEGWGSWVSSLLSHSALGVWFLAQMVSLLFSSAQYCGARMARQAQVARPLRESHVAMPE